MSDVKKENLDENYNLGEDFEDEEEIITLFNEDTQKEEEFRIIWVVEYNDRSYVLLNPVEPTDEIGEDEVFIYEFVETDEGEDVIPVDSEETLQAVYDEYVKEYELLVAEEGANE